MIPLSELRVEGDSWVYGGRYEPISANIDFGSIVCDLGAACEHYTFVDTGCGKGRAVLQASELPFRKVVGVEFAPDLVQIARANLGRWPAERRQCGSIEIRCDAALKYDLPPGPLVLFFYNTFGSPLMD